MIDYTFSYQNLEYLLLIFIRVTGFIAVAPLFGGQNTGVPNMVRIGLSMLMAVMLYGVTPRPEIVYTTVTGYAVIVLKEVATGLMIGLAAQICMTIASFAGQIVDMQSGLSMVQMMDPTSNLSVTVSGAMYNQAIMALFIVTGTYRFLISAIADSFKLIPVNGMVWHADATMTAMLNYMRDYIILGFRISLPVFVVTFILNIILGVLAKVAPQMNMFTVGMQLKVLVGLSVFFVATSMLGHVSDFIFQYMKTLITEFISAMRP